MFLTQDLAENVSASGREAGLAGRVGTTMTVRFLAVFLFRCAQAVGSRSGLLAGLLKQLNHVLTGADVAWQARIGAGLVLFHPTGVVIGPHVAVGPSCHIQQGVTIGGDGGPSSGAGASPVLGANVRVGAGARVLGPVSLGDGVQVGANAVVTKSFPSGARLVGVPARSL